MKKRVCGFLCVCLALTVASPAVAQTLFATEACGRCGGIDQPPLPTMLWTLYPVTVPVGDMGQSVTGIDFHPTTGVLYGTTTPNSPWPSSLITINPSTAATALIGPHGLDEAISDLTFAPDGRLFGWLEPNHDRIVEIDLQSDLARMATAHPICSAALRGTRCPRLTGRPKPSTFPHLTESESR